MKFHRLIIAIAVLVTACNGALAASKPQKKSVKAAPVSEQTTTKSGSKKTTAKKTTETKSEKQKSEKTQSEKTKIAANPAAKKNRGRKKSTAKPTVAASAAAIAPATVPIVIPDPPPAEYTQKISDMQQSIDTLRDEIDRLKAERNEQQSQVEKLDKDVSDTSRKTGEIARKLEDKQRALDALHDEKKTVGQSVSGQREQISRQLRALYEAGAQSQLRLLLNQKDSNTVARNLQYYDYLFSARREKMHAYVEAISRLNNIEKDIAIAVADMQATRTELETEQTTLVQQRDQRQQLLNAANAQLEDKGAELQQLEQDRQALQKVIERIEKERAIAKAREEQRLREEALRLQQEEARRKLEAQRQQEEAQRQQAEIERQQQVAQRQQEAAQHAAQQDKPAPAEPDPEPTPAARTTKAASPAYSAKDLERLQSMSFTQRKGSMPWPAQGKLLNRFGDTRQGSVSWDGVRIQAAPGAEVQAIHGGRVMYADWLRGQGMLMVLDHGNGYMSLYAHNDQLLREPGEWVQAGDSIARVGNSGGEKESALYFEIRQNGQPVNPLPWLGKP